MECMLKIPECPHCGELEMTFYLRGKYVSGKTISFWECGSCGRAICVETFVNLDNVTRINYSDCCAIYPSPPEQLVPEGTPEEIAGAFLAARTNAQMEGPGFWAASAIMARRSLELACIDFGETGKESLAVKLNALGKRGILTQNMAEWAKEVRLIGNQGAHKESVTKEDAEQAVYFAEMLFTYLYKLPKMIEERRNKKQ